MKRKIYVFYGPPGSGKGAQAGILSKKLKIPSISSGELFRREIKLKTALGGQIGSILSQGKLVSEQITNCLIFKRISQKDAKKGFVLDGYPRTISQLNNLKNQTNLKKNEFIFILVDVSDQEIKKRLGGRRACLCGETYHLIYKPPKEKGFCDRCGGRLFVRSDDQPEVIKTRLKLYHKTTEPVIKKSALFGQLIKINGEQPIIEVGREIAGKIKAL